jgi:soluble lytic murein transglycosylase
VKNWRNWLESPGVRRALALLRMNMRIEGVREWNWALRGMNDRDLLAASELANRAGVYDRAIAAADRTREEHDYSAALPVAVQRAGASGRQQPVARRCLGLRPDAPGEPLRHQRQVDGRRLRADAADAGDGEVGGEEDRPASDYHHGQVNDTETNVLLGTSYMRMVMESLDNHPVLASAAYNAGPGRARKWRADRPLEGAVYAETIPFNETRDYVKKVMSNAVYYSALFKASHSRSRAGSASSGRGQMRRRARICLSWLAESALCRCRRAFRGKAGYLRQRSW